MMSDYRMRGAAVMMGGSTGGMMGGCGGTGMRGGYADPTWTPGTTTAAISPAKAKRLAQRWLDRQGSNLTASEPDVFPGYYTLHVLRDGKVTGMLSVNAANRRRLEPLVARSVRLHAGGASE